MARAQHRQDDEPPDSSQPDVGRPPSPWREVPLGSWNDWRWQLTHRLRSVEDFARVVNLTAVEAFVALDGLDVGRVDFRLDAAGRPNRVEINTLPGLNPTLSDMVIVSRAAGISYEWLINEIVKLARERHGI